MQRKCRVAADSAEGCASAYEGTTGKCYNGNAALIIILTTTSNLHKEKLADTQDISQLFPKHLDRNK